MRYINQFARLLAFCGLGELCHTFLPLPIPASVYGLVLLLLALCCGIVKLEQVREAGLFLTGIFPLLFVPAAAGVMDLWSELGDILIPAVIAILPVTALVFIAAGHTTQAILRFAKQDAQPAASESVPEKESPADLISESVRNLENLASAANARNEGILSQNEEVEL